jgi:anti-sigma B factor antagonist
MSQGGSTIELTVERRETGDITLIYPRGFINAHTVRAFERELQETLKQKRFKIVINCSGLAYIASAGLGALMGVVEEVRGNGGDLRLTELNETVRNIMEILGFNRLYRIFPSEMDAVLSFRQPAGTAS